MLAVRRNFEGTEFMHPTGCRGGVQQRHQHGPDSEPTRLRSPPQAFLAESNCFTHAQWPTRSTLTVSVAGELLGGLIHEYQLAA